ncbi:MAG: glycosyltransferase family 39 protein [Bradyrhizobiaceae bacterium]|nr:glycosyltransferase family 39 protein [Bradyrhizobiaceae bacterium]
MNELSDARQSAGGAAVSLASIGERPWACFLVFALAHAAIWAVLPFVFFPNLPLDLIEALTYGREWQIGYDKLPPLPWWLAEAAYRAFDSDLAYYVLGQISVLSAFAAVWALMLRVASPAAALASVLIIDGLHYFNFTSPKFNHDVVQLPFWALAGLSFHGALRTGRPGYWAALGVALGLAFWAKYFVVVLALPLALFLLADRRGRHCLATPGPWLAAAVGLAIAAPHLVWLWQNDWLPLNYLASRAKATGSLIGHLTHPAGFALAQLFWLMPAFVIALPLWRHSSPSKADGFDRRIIGLLAFGPAVAVVAGSALSGRELVAMWGYPLWLFLGCWIAVTVPPPIARAAVAPVTVAWAVVTACYVASFAAQYAVLPHLDHRHRAVLFPGQQLAQQISTRYHAQTGTPLRYVVGSMWLGGNIAHYSADHPRTLIDGDPRRAPWIDLGNLAAAGGVAVWIEDHPQAVPAAYAAVAPNAVVQPPFTLRYQRGNGEVTIGWAIIPPI